MSTVPAILKPAEWRVSPLRRIADYWILTKPEVNFLVVISVLAGFYAASPASLEGMLLAHTLVGTLLVASGTATLNQLMERAPDARMRRTSQRPLPAGRMPATHALGFGMFLSVAGGAYLLVAVNALACILAMSTLLTYLLVYTPLKQRTPWCTFLGAFPGAAPPLIGWAGAAGSLSRDAWVLYFILFLWQFPHFLAIAWMYRDEYAGAGILLLPVIEPDGRSTGRQAVLYTAGLLPISLMPSLVGLAGGRYLFGALALGVMLMWLSVEFSSTRSIPAARRLFVGSIIYLPVLWVMLVGDHFTH